MSLRDRLALRPKEAAAMLGISERKLREVQSRLPRVVIDGVILFPRRALEAWLEQQAVVEDDQVDAVVLEALRDLKT